MAHHPFPWREAFLAALREYPVIAHACKAAGIDRSTAYRTRESDKDFAKAWDDAQEDGVDRAEAEAFRRGVVGFEEPVFHQGRLQFAYERYLDEDGKEQFRAVLDANGQPVPATVRKHSDAMLGLVLKARRAAYRIERTELTGADGAPLAVDETTRKTRVQALLDGAAKRRRIAEDFG